MGITQGAFPEAPVGIWYCPECGEEPISTQDPHCVDCASKTGEHRSESSQRDTRTLKTPDSVGPSDVKSNVSSPAPSPTLPQAAPSTPRTTAKTPIGGDIPRTIPQLVSPPLATTQSSTKGVAATDDIPTRLILPNERLPKSPFTLPKPQFSAEDVGRTIWHGRTVHHSIQGLIGIEDIDGDHFERKLVIELRRMGKLLERGAVGNLSRIRIAKFISKKARSIAKAIRANADCVSTFTEARPDRYPLFKIREFAGISDDDSSADESASDHDAEHLDASLTDIWNNLLDSVAYNTMLDRIQEYTHLTFQSLTLRYIKHAAEGVSPQREKAARDFAHQLEEIEPSTVRVFDVSNPGLLDRGKAMIETMSGQSWDWWPLSSPFFTHPGTYLEWTCNCGDIRRQHVPRELAELVTRFSISLTSSGQSETNNTAPSEVSSQSLQSNYRQAPGGAQQGSGGQPRSFNLPEVPQPCFRPGYTFEESMAISAYGNYTDGRVLLVVKVHEQYKLKQIFTRGLTSHEFFVRLRSDYYQLRGILSRFFSVWDFSHCDFYQFEKFNQGSYAPRKRDDYPEKNNKEYYPLVSTIAPPPITKHEFRKRFYDCAAKRFHIRCHKNCHCAKLKHQAHNREIIDRLIRKRNRLDIRSDQRVIFWGLYARQQIRFWRVMAYNVICISPLIWFFFMWMFYWGHGADMQNASVPLMAMISLLSMFWAAFIVSLRSEE